MAVRPFRILLKRVSRALTRSGIPGVEYSLNPYIGCTHGCLYCYSRELFSQLDWGSVVIVKVNLISVLRKEIGRLRPRRVALSTSTDPYQPVESLYRLTRRSLEVLLHNKVRVSIQTRNPLVLRDLDIILDNRDLVDVGFSITTLSPSVTKILEPSAPPPRARVKALEELSSRGVRTWIFLGPILPSLTDSEENLEEVLRVAKETQSYAIVDKLRVKSFMLREGCRIREIALRSLSYDWGSLMKKVENLCKSLGVRCIRAFA